MRYLGRFSGKGKVQCNGEELAAAWYDLDCFSGKPAGLSRSGEIRLSATLLQGLFGRRDLQLLFEDGSLLPLSFTEKQLSPGSDIAHVDVNGEAIDKRPSLSR